MAAKSWLLLHGRCHIVYLGHESTREDLTVDHDIVNVPMWSRSLDAILVTPDGLTLH